MQEKKVKVIFNKSGGTAGSGGITNRVTIPTTWVREMGVTEGDREVTLEFNGSEIVIRKKHEKIR